MEDVQGWRRAVLEASKLSGEELARFGLLVDGLIEAVREESGRAAGLEERPLSWTELAEIRRRYEEGGGWHPDWLDRGPPEEPGARGS